MVDIHSHILHGLDDGPEIMEETIAMVGIAAKNEIHHIVASSHGNYYSYDLQEYQHQFERLQQEIRARQIPVTVYPGMEIFVNGQALHLLEAGQLLSINHTNYLLIEFHFEENPENVCRYIDKLRNKNYNIILAHPERYIFMQKNPELAWYLEETGCVLQVNKGSLLGDFGEKCRTLAKAMMDDGIVRVIGTDAHDTVDRSPDLGRLMRMLKGEYSPVEIRLWLSENPSRILKGYPTIGLNARKEEE